MPSITQQIQAATRNAQRQLRGSAATYSRGETTVQLPLAVPAKSKWETRDARNQLAVSFSNDWLIDDGDLGLTPQRDDKITVTHNGLVTVYQVLPFGSEGRCWRWSDQPGGTRRVYTKQVSETEAES
jgi:hypothetical protein